MESVMLEQTDIDFYPRPPRGGRLCGLRGRAAAGRISIHALREEGDSGYRLALNRLLISIHALREEGDVVERLSLEVGIYFYPRPPRGGRPLEQGHSQPPG